jgi:FAD:protein FMN transferase
MSDRPQVMGLRSPAPAAPNYALPEGCDSVTWTAMGTTLYLIAPAAQLAVALDSCRSLFARWEAALSRFRPESELSQLNANAGKVTPVSDLLWDVLAKALEAARASKGLYDPALGQQMAWIGYERTFSEIAGSTVSASALPLLLGGGWRGIRLGAERRTVTLPAGTLLDFGGIAKGMAVDAALAELAAMDIAPVLLNAGGDLAVLGTPTEGAWRLAVPGVGAERTVTLRSGAMATSSVGQRRWRQGQNMRHHLLDPRTGLPIDNGLYAVTVAAQQCAQAEVAAKVALILGEHQGAAFLERWGIAGRFVTLDGCVVTAAGWPEEEG